MLGPVTFQISLLRSLSLFFSLSLLHKGIVTVCGDPVKEGVRVVVIEYKRAKKYKHSKKTDVC